MLECIRFVRRSVAVSCLALGPALLAGCGNGTPATPCPAEPRLAVEGYSTGTTPFVDGIEPATGAYPTSATYIYFSTDPGSTSVNLVSVTGVPTLDGSDGSTITGGAIVPVTAFDITPILFGYSSTISGLKPNLTYSLDFGTLTGVQSGCRYGPEGAGSFQTQGPVLGFRRSADARRHGSDSRA